MGYEDRPSPSDLAEDEFDHDIRSRPRGYGPPWQGEDPPSDTHTFPAQHYIDDEGPNPDLLHSPGFGEQEVHDDHFGPDDEPDYPPHEHDKALNDFEHQYPGEAHHVGAVLRQADQFPFRTAAREHLGEHANIDEHFYNRDPGNGPTVPDMVGGDPHGVTSINPGSDLKVMHPHETGLEHPVLVRPNDRGDGYDVIHHLQQRR